MEQILNPELFVFPVDSKNERLILYVPLEGSAVEVNSDALFLLRKLNSGEQIDLENSLLKKLRDLKIIVDSGYTPVEKKNNISDGYSPTSLTIIPTFNCNLRCVYCYSNGGERPLNLEFEIAKKAIDLIIDNNLRTESKEAGLGFHGGGEPLLEENMDFVKRCVDYFRSQTCKNGIKSRVVSATNGIIGRTSLEWICSNFDFLNISLDGPPDIQNLQRPTKFNGPSYPHVKATIDTLEKKGLEYAIRSTITSDSVILMPEILKFFLSISSVKSIQFEPLFECGRCKTTKTKAPIQGLFADYFLESIAIARERQVKLSYSGSKISYPSQTFCGATGSNFFLTPQGYVTTCLEVSREDDSSSEVFLIGKCIGDKFVFDSQRIEHLKNRKVSNLTHCSDCLSKYSCSGDCLNKCYLRSGNIYDTSQNTRCEINRKLLKSQILSMLGGDNKNG